jgi:hypothetical protein
MWPWKVSKWPWFWAEVAVKAWRDLATLIPSSRNGVLSLKFNYPLLLLRYYECTVTVKSNSMDLRKRVKTRGKYKLQCKSQCYGEPQKAASFWLS